jgi:hypothetical protein
MCPATTLSFQVDCGSSPGANAVFTVLGGQQTPTPELSAFRF